MQISNNPWYFALINLLTATVNVEQDSECLELEELSYLAEPTMRIKVIFHIIILQMRMNFTIDNNIGKKLDF